MNCSSLACIAFLFFIISSVALLSSSVPHFLCCMAHLISLFSWLFFLLGCVCVIACFRLCSICAHCRFTSFVFSVFYLLHRMGLFGSISGVPMVCFPFPE